MEVVLMEEITLSDADCVVTSELLQCLLRACKRSLSTSIRDASTENPLPRRPGKPLPRCRVCSRPHEGSPQHLPALRCRFLFTQHRVSTAVTSAISFEPQQSSKYNQSLDIPSFGNNIFHDPRVRGADPCDRAVAETRRSLPLLYYLNLINQSIDHPTHVLEFVTSALFLRRHIATRLLPKGTMLSRLRMYPQRVLILSHLDGYYPVSGSYCAFP
jgi:hypothetical protein